MGLGPSQKAQGINMASILSAIGAFFGQILKFILPVLIKQGKKPRDVKPAGYDKCLQENINESIEKESNNDNGDTS